MWWNPMYQTVGAENLGSSLIGGVPDPQTCDWARAQMRRTSLATALSAIQAVPDFTSHDWAAGIDCPPPSSCQHATTSCTRGVGASAKNPLEAAAPGALGSSGQSGTRAAAT
jgi:hypothetical protein